MEETQSVFNKRERSDEISTFGVSQLRKVQDMSRLDKDWTQIEPIANLANESKEFAVLKKNKYQLFPY
jgi:hypothetical protein